jgi:CheY-like chemotaxis protein
MSQAPAKFLIADDDPVVRHILSAILQSSGNEVVAASSGGECIAKLEEAAASGALPNGIFVDMFLGDLTGLEVLAKIRANHATAKIPVIMLSANPKDEVLRGGEEMAPDAYLEKPFVADTVLAALGNLKLT